MAKTIANKAPRNENWMVRELRLIKARLKNLESGRRILNAAEIDAGGLKITKGGALTVVDPSTGTPTAFIGATGFNDGSSRTQMQFQLRRSDNTVALVLGDLGLAVGHAFQQALQWFDRAGNIVLADDTNGGRGLAKPHIESTGLHDTNTGTWPATSNTAFTSIANGYQEIQNPLLTWQIQMFSDAGVSSQFRMLINGTQVGTIQSVAAGTFGFWSTNATLPANVNIGDVVFIELQAKTSASTGSARAICLRLAGQQS